MDSRPMQMTLGMSKTRSGFVTGGLKAGVLRRKSAVTEALRAALDACAARGLDREAVANELSRLEGEPISVHTLNNWCSQGKENRRLPLEYAEALVLITGERGLLDAAFAVHRVLDTDEAPYYELGVIVAEERARSKRKRQALEKIGV